MAAIPSRMSAALVLAAGLAGVPGQARAANLANTNRDPSVFVEQRIRDWDISRAERRFDEIGWAHTIRDALRLAREHQRPVFLFTHDGRMAVGRC